MNTTLESSSANPYEPDFSVTHRHGSDEAPSILVQKLRRRPWLSWALPLFGLCVWFYCYQFSEQVMFWVIDVPNFKNPGFETYMHVVTMIAGAFWAIGGLHQIMLLAFRKQIPGIVKHLAPGLVLSACCGGGYLLSIRETTQTVIDYPIRRRGPISEQTQESTPPVSPSQSARP